MAEQVLHQRISQLRTEEKSNIVPEKAGATLTPEAEAKARELLRLKIAEARKADLTQPRPNPEAQAKALTVLHQSDAEVQAEPFEIAISSLSATITASESRPGKERFTTCGSTYSGMP